MRESLNRFIAFSIRVKCALALILLLGTSLLIGTPKRLLAQNTSTVEFVVEPYLQQVTDSSFHVLRGTSGPGKGNYQQ
jgi:hypothetical protein